MHRIGDIIDDRYQLTRPLGARSGAEMWEAEHRLAGRKVTLKIVPDADSSARDRLVTEARVAAEIGHPSVVEVYDVGVAEGGLAYLVTELLRGETLADIVASHGAMQPEDACQVMLQVLAGLEAAHVANVAHGDLHADDIVLRKGRNGQLVVKILDFGRAMSDGRAQALDDIQAVGAILYEMLTGRSAVRQGAPARAAQASSSEVPEMAQSLVPAIPQALARIVDDALAVGTTKGAAVTSAKKVAEQLAPFAISDRAPSLAPRETLMPFLSKEARKTRGMARLERAVLGLENKPSARPPLYVIEGSQEKVARTDRPSRAPQPHAVRSTLESDDLIEPRIPRPPRTPKHIGGSVPRLMAADRIDGGHRRKSSLTQRRWKASRAKHVRDKALTKVKSMSPVSRRIWSAILLAAAGLGAGLLLAHLLHF
jgi:serine/threonine protein kinase